MNRKRNVLVMQHISLSYCLNIGQVGLSASSIPRQVLLFLPLLYLYTSSSLVLPLLHSCSNLSFPPPPLYYTISLPSFLSTLFRTASFSFYRQFYAFPHTRFFFPPQFHALLCGRLLLSPPYHHIPSLSFLSYNTDNPSCFASP